MICWIFGTGLLSLKQQKNKHEFWNQVVLPAKIRKFLTEFGLGGVRSLSMLLVWWGSETSHHLGEERQNFVIHFTGFAQWHPVLSNNSDTLNFALSDDKKDGPKHLVVIVVGVSRISYDVDY